MKVHAKELGQTNWKWENDKWVPADETRIIIPEYTEPDYAESTIPSIDDPLDDDPDIHTS